MEISGIERKIIFFKKRIEDFYEKENKLELKKKSKPENYKIKRKIEFVKESCELEKKYMEKWIFNLSQTNHELNKINELIEIKMS